MKKLVAILNKLLVGKNILKNTRGQGYDKKILQKFCRKINLLNLCHMEYTVVIAHVHAASSNMPGLMFLNFVSFQHQTGSYIITAVILLALC